MVNVLNSALKTARESGLPDMKFADFFCVCNALAERQGNFGLSYLATLDAAAKQGLAFQDSGLIWRVKL